MTNIDNLFMDIEQRNDDKVHEVVQELGVDARDIYGRTPLINASFYGNETLLPWLIDNGADVNAQDKQGFSALHFAIQECRSECVRILLDNSANPNIQDVHGNTPAAVAMVNWRGGDNQVNLKALVDAGANLTIANNAGRSVSDILPDAIKQALDDQK